MKRSFKKLSVMVLVMALMLSAVLPGVTFAENGDKAVTITIAHTNDTHGRVKEGKYDGMGFAKISTKIQELRANNSNVLVLDAGDTFHGLPIASISKGKSIVDVMNTIKYDAMVPGNHDFNYGQDRLLELAKLADFPIIASNIVKTDGTKLLTQYVIKEFEGVKIAIFGLATPETEYKTNPKNVAGLTFSDPVKAAKEMVAELKDQADVIIALSHLGLDEASTYTSQKVAEEVDGIDIIVDGHSHTTLPEGKQVGNTLIAQAGNYDQNLGILNVVVENGKVTKTAELFTKEAAVDLTEDQSIVALVEAIDAENSSTTSVVLGNAAVELNGERENVRTGETNLGNLVTEAMLKAAGADVAFTNGGGFRASIDAGEITMGEIITVLPFGNYGVVKAVKGADIIEALENGVSAYPNPHGPFPHVAGMTFTFDPSKEAGNRINTVSVGGKTINPDATYKLVTNDFIAAGGDQYTMLAEGDIVAEYGQLDELVAEYIKELGTIDVKVDGRVSVVKPQVNETEETYVVKVGDVLWKIAKQFGLTYEKLAEYNQLKNAHLIFPGQKLLIPQP